jgi:hypothetical protein
VDLDAFLTATADRDRRRMQRIHRALQMYRGDQPKPLRVLPGEPDDNMRINMAGLVVDTGVDALFGQDVPIEIVDDADQVDTEVTDYLDTVWGMNGGMLLWQAVATNGAVSGHAALRIVPAAEGSPVGTPPRLLPVDPEMLRVVWAPDDVGRVEAYVLQWIAYDQRGREIAKRQVIRPDGSEWVIIDQESKDVDGARWVTVPNGETRWRYSWAPIVDTQNLPEPNAYFGRPDLTEDVVETQLAINRVLSNAARVQRIHGHPKVVAKGVGEGDLDVGPDEAIVLPDSDSEVSLLEPRATVADHIELFKTVKSALHEISRVPEITAGKLDGVGQLSGLALKILYGPLVRKTEVKRRLYGQLMHDVAVRVAELGGYGAGLDATMRWPEIIPDDPMMQAATAEALQRAGVSVATTLGEMGYDPEVESERRRDDQTNIGAALLTAFDQGIAAQGE